MKNKTKNSLIDFFSYFYFYFVFKRTKEIGESSKTILQKKTNKSSNSRSSTTLNNSKQQRTTINQDYHLSPTTNNQLLPSERPLRFFFLFY
jgi:negative regulator of replication initiation